MYKFAFILLVNVKVRDPFPYLLKNLRRWQILIFISVMQVALLQPAGEREFKSS
jgi:hypothetical protein